MSNFTSTQRMVYQPNEANWPDGLASFEAFASIEGGRKHYPEIAASQWSAIPESHIEDAAIFEDEPEQEVAEITVHNFEGTHSFCS